jgi:two-component system, NarL family, nitrate/nitrite response regulator NarL
MRVGGPLRLLIADDHAGFRHELRSVFARDPDFRVVAEESNGADALLRVRALRPQGLDLVLMDIDMPIMDGLQAAAAIAATDPSLPIIILTVSRLDRDLFAGLESGAVGFLNKDLSPATFLRTLRDFQRYGALPMSRVRAGKVVRHLQRQRRSGAQEKSEPAPGLTWRERDILDGIAAGAHDAEIAASLGVAESTVKTHVRHILDKLGARNRAEAAARLRRGASE